MVVSINYSDDKYKKNQSFNSWTAKKIGKVDKVISYSPADVDREFYNANKELFSQKRGGGLWLWKPYVILKTLKEMEEDDYLLYVDSGMFFKKNIKGLIDKLIGSKQNIMLFELPLLEIQWTKKQVFEYFNIIDHDFLYSNQLMASTMCFKKCNETILFVEKWLLLCQEKTLLLPNTTCEQQFEKFISHREDQSIISVLGKLHNLKPFSDPTNYGRMPLEYLDRNRLFRVVNYESQYNIDQIYFLHCRSSNPLIYFLKFCIKNVIRKVGFLNKI